MIGKRREICDRRVAMAKERGGERAVEPVSRAEARGRGLRWLNQMVFGVLCLCVGSMVVAAAWPERKRTAEMERTLAETLERERESLARREQHQLELEALKQDREYLELRARDRLDWYREGERVYRIVRPE